MRRRRLVKDLERLLLIMLMRERGQGLAKTRQLSGREGSELCLLDFLFLLVSEQRDRVV